MQALHWKEKFLAQIYNLNISVYIKCGREVFEGLRFQSHGELCTVPFKTHPHPPTETGPCHGQLWLFRFELKTHLPSPSNYRLLIFHRQFWLYRFKSETSPHPIPGIGTSHGNLKQDDSVETTLLTTRLPPHWVHVHIASVRWWHIFVMIISQNPSFVTPQKYSKSIGNFTGVHYFQLGFVFRQQKIYSPF